MRCFCSQLNHLRGWEDKNLKFRKLRDTLDCPEIIKDLGHCTKGRMFIDGRWAPQIGNWLIRRFFMPTCTARFLELVLAACWCKYACVKCGHASQSADWMGAPKPKVHGMPWMPVCWVRHCSHLQALQFRFPCHLPFPCSILLPPFRPFLGSSPLSPLRPPAPPCQGAPGGSHGRQRHDTPLLICFLLQVQRRGRGRKNCVSGCVAGRPVRRGAASSVGAARRSAPRPPARRPAEMAWETERQRAPAVWTQSDTRPRPPRQRPENSESGHRTGRRTAGGGHRPMTCPTAGQGGALCSWPAPRPCCCTGDQLKGSARRVRRVMVGPCCAAGHRVRASWGAPERIQFRVVTRVQVCAAGYVPKRISSGWHGCWLCGRQQWLLD